MADLLSDLFRPDRLGVAVQIRDFRDPRPGHRLRNLLAYRRCDRLGGIQDTG